MKISSWKLILSWRLEKGSETSNELYELMLKCWADDPKSRPSFKELNYLVQELLKPVTGNVTDNFTSGSPDNQYETMNGSMLNGENGYQTTNIQ